LIVEKAAERRLLVWMGVTVHVTLCAATSWSYVAPAVLVVRIRRSPRSNQLAGLTAHVRPTHAEMEGPIEMAASGLNLRRNLADVLGVLAQEHLRSMNAEIGWALRQYVAAWEDGTEEKLW
jgi:hypothetical protein